MGYYNTAACRKITIHRAGAVCFRKVHFIGCDVGNYFSIPLTGWFTGGVNVHFEMSYTSVVVKVDHGVTHPHPWKAIDFITC